MKGLADPRLAQRLREGRENAKLSMEDEARAVGVSKGAIWQYETAKIHIPIERLTDIANAIGCDVRDFLKPPGSPFPRPRIRFRPPRGDGAPELAKLGDDLRQRIASLPPGATNGLDYDFDSFVIPLAPRQAVNGVSPCETSCAAPPSKRLADLRTTMRKTQDLVAELSALTKSFSNRSSSE